MTSTFSHVLRMEGNGRLSGRRDSGDSRLKNYFKKCDDVKKKVVLRKGVKDQNLVFLG